MSKMSESAHQENMLSKMTAMNEKFDRLEKNIWNAAIEAAANWLETANRNDTDDAKEIRKLKK